MIAALLLAISAKSVLETLSPNVSRIRIVGILSLPPLGPHATRITRSIVASMNGNTEDFTRRQVLDIVVSGPRFEWTPDHIRIEFGVSPRGLKTGLRLMESLIRRPSTDPFIPAADPSPWMKVAYQVRSDRRAIDPKEVLAVCSEIFRLNRITLAVSGPISPGEATRTWQDVASENADLKPIRFFEPPSEAESVNPSVKSIVGPAISAADPELPSTILAMIALGSGKASTLHRVLREQLGLSYRQEAVLTPIAQGWIPQLIYQLPEGVTAERASAVQPAIATDVAQWNEATRKRALGMAKVIFRLGVPFSPLYNEPSGASDSDEETFFDAWWFSRTGKRFDVASFLDHLDSVDLATLQKTATQIVSGSPLANSLK